MCGRYALTKPPELIASLFGITLLRQMRARYNIAPTQAAPVVRQITPAGPRTLDPLRWGLIPHWAADDSIAAQTVNARAETADTRNTFRHAFGRRRCLVPADGFYEWKQLTPRVKQPYFIYSADHAPLALAGLWESWRPTGTDQEDILTFTILTVPANSTLAPLHDRMPAIIPPEHFEKWLDPSNQSVPSLKSLLAPAPGSLLAMHPVRTLVNHPANDEPACLEPVPELRPPPDTPTLFP